MCVVLDDLLDNSDLCGQHTEHFLTTNDDLMCSEVKELDVDSIGSGSSQSAQSSNNIFYDSNLFSSTDLDDRDLLGGNLDLDCLTTSGLDFLADCESLMIHRGGGVTQDAGGDTTGTQTMQLLCDAGIQHPAERQIRLHSELAQHLSSSPDDVDSVLSKCDSKPSTTASSSSESELVRVLTTSLNDGESCVSRLVTSRHIGNAGVRASAAITPGDALSPSLLSYNSELIRQLSVCADDNGCTAGTPQQQQPRVALVQPTIARPATTVDTTNIVGTQVVVGNHPYATSVENQPTSSQLTITHQMAAALSAQNGSLQIGCQNAVVSTEQNAATAVPRQIVITTQAPAQAQHIPQITLQQLQQVSCILMSLLCPSQLFVDFPFFTLSFSFSFQLLCK